MGHGCEVQCIIPQGVSTLLRVSQPVKTPRLEEQEASLVRRRDSSIVIGRVVWNPRNPVGLRQMQVMFGSWEYPLPIGMRRARSCPSMVCSSFVFVKAVSP